MAKSGPKRVPAAILALRGAKIAGKRAQEEVKYEGIPEPPQAISGRARQIWSEIVPPMIQVGIVAKVDQAAIWAYCECVALAEKCTSEIEKTGQLVTVDMNGGKKANPLISVRDAAFSQLRRYADEFGFTPASRSNVHKNEHRDRNKDNQGPTAEDFIQLAPEVARN
jgi:P27 family predicted phage terminase small subunit